MNECEDYKIGKFIPLSFDSILDWEITESNECSVGEKKLPRSIVFKGKIFNTELVVYSRPYSFGEHRVKCDAVQFGLLNIYTNDYEEALYIAEAVFFEEMDERKYLYTQICGLKEKR